MHSRCRRPDEIVHILGAIQAQDYTSALWAIGLRCPGSTQDKIEQSLAQHHIVRTWAMRGTIHFLAAEDVRWLLKLLAPRVLGSTDRRDHQLGLDAATYTRSRKLLEKALQGNKQLPRDEVYAVLERGNISTEGQRGYHILWRLGLEGTICFGLHEGKQPSFALLDEWVPESRQLERDAALAELALRYFNSRGPATVQDFAAWAKLSLTESRTALEATTSALQQFTHEDETFWMPQELPVSDATPEAFLLPAFDEYLLGYKDRSTVLAAKHANKIVPGGNGMFLPMMVLRGEVAGTWKRKLKKESVCIEYTPFDKLKETEQTAFNIASQCYGQFLKLMVE